MSNKHAADGRYDFDCQPNRSEWGLSIAENKAEPSTDMRILSKCMDFRRMEIIHHYFRSNKMAWRACMESHSHRITEIMFILFFFCVECQFCFGILGIRG